MNIKPKISIICPTYNHEKYIKEALDSILNQTFNDFEVIIVDDCSKDNTVSVVKTYSDPRIRLFTKNFNKGINDSINIAMANVRGEYIVIMGTDDVMKSNYLVNVYNTFLKNPNLGVVYTNLIIIDEKSNIVKTKKREDLIWVLPKFKNKYEILNKMFLKGNCLHAPGMAVNTELLRQLSPFDNSIINMQDYQMHINLLLKSDYLIIDQPGIMYRCAPEHNSISAKNQNTISRENAEIPKLMDSYLQIDDLEMLKKIFPEDSKYFKNSNLIPFYLGKEALNSNNVHRQIWGYRTIMNFIADKENLDILYNEEQFDFAKYLLLIKDFTFENSNINMKLQKKYKKYKKLFNLLLFISIILFVTFVILMLFILLKCN